ncbi:MAG: preprotein translocase subunit SecE [Dehalococcoidia bacterium]|nr:MAG: preprotein translocase subunit SecE [Dehalococcoidia bacterium]
MRRSQERAERRQKAREAQQPRRSSLPPTSTSAPEAPRTGSLLKPRWALDIISELKKVTWPSRREVANLTTVVVVISMLLGLVMGGADLFFGWLMEQTLLR